MDKYELLKEKLNKRTKIVGTTMVQFNDPILLEKMKRDDVDFILFDEEHGRFDTQNLIPLLHACRILDIPSVVRVPDSQYFLIAKVIDMGADGIMLPRTQTLKQLKVAVDAIYFYPIGRKGAGGNGQFRTGETFEQFQKGRLLFPQIESQEGIDLLPKMLEEYGQFISGIIVGPYDMSIVVGTPLDIHSSVMQKSIQKVIDTCNAFEKSVGVFCNDEKEAQKYRNMGANILWTATDLVIYMKSYNQIFNALSKIK